MHARPGKICSHDFPQIIFQNSLNFSKQNTWRYRSARSGRCQSVHLYHRHHLSRPSAPDEGGGDEAAVGEHHVDGAKLLWMLLLLLLLVQAVVDVLAAAKGNAL